jgi:hypothetical protein
MVTDEELAEGGYRFDDLLRNRIVSGRTDLQRKQKQHGFPKPVKTGVRQNWYLKTEVHDWLRKRMAMRDRQTNALPLEPPAPRPARRGIRGA